MNNLYLKIKVTLAKIIFFLGKFTISQLSHQVLTACLLLFEKKKSCFKVWKTFGETITNIQLTLKKATRTL